MSLLVWLPLNGNLENQGLRNVTVTNNGATVNNNGKIGKCYSFSGGSNCLIVNYGKNIPANNLSISCWAYVVANSNDKIIFGVANGSNQRLYVGIKSDYYQLAYGAQNWGSTPNTAKATIGEWHHIAVSIGNNVCSMYYDGKFIHSISQAAFNFASDIMIGGRTDGFTGSVKINDFRIYDHALSAKEVKELSKGLVLHYRLAGPGQPNLLNGNIHLASAWSQENHTVVNYSDSNFTGLKITATQANGRIYNNVSNLWITNNAKYTVSFWAKSDTAGTTIDCSRSLRDFSPTFTLDTNWKYYSGIITTTETSAGGTLSIRIKQASRVVYIANIKVENGAIATPFVPPSNSSIYSAMGYNDNIEYDCSGYKHNGIPAAPTMRPIWDADSPRYTTSFKYDGNVNRVNYTTSTDMNFTDNFSWAIWINPNYTSGKTQFVFTGGRADAGGYGYGLEVTSTTSCRIFYGNNGRYPVEAKSGEWHHVAFTKSGTTCKCYLDGKLISTNTFGGTNPTYSDGNGVGIGCFHHAGNIYPYFGKASDFRIYATALSAEDIAELYHTAAIVDNQNNLYAYEYVEEEAHA